MGNTATTGKSNSLTITSVVSILIIGLNIIGHVNSYWAYDQNGWMYKEWFLVMVLINMLMIAGVLLLYFQKKPGLWIFLLSIIAFFAVPIIGGKDDTVLGIMTPVYFFVYSILFVLLGKQYKKLFF